MAPAPSAVVAAVAAPGLVTSPLPTGALVNNVHVGGGVIPNVIAVAPAAPVPVPVMAPAAGAGVSSDVVAVAATAALHQGGAVGAVGLS